MSPLKIHTDSTRCPNCGERVTPYAAGCWLCGADLDPRRWHPTPTVAQRALARWRSAFARGRAD